jgi:hypothetical protein
MSRIKTSIPLAAVLLFSPTASAVAESDMAVCVNGSTTAGIVLMPDPFVNSLGDSEPDNISKSDKTRPCDIYYDPRRTAKRVTPKSNTGSVSPR